MKPFPTLKKTRIGLSLTHSAGICNCPHNPDQHIRKALQSKHYLINNIKIVLNLFIIKMNSL